MVVEDQMVEGLAGRGEEGQNQQILQETEAGSHFYYFSLKNWLNPVYCSWSTNPPPPLIIDFTLFLCLF